MKFSFREFKNIVRNYKWQSIFFKYWVIIVIIFVLPIFLFTYISFSSYTKSVEKEIENKYMQSFIKTKTVLSDIFTQIDNNANLILSKDSTAILLTQKDSAHSGLITKQFTNELYNILSAVKLSSNYLESIYLYSGKNKYVFSLKNSNYIDIFFDSGWLMRYNEHKTPVSVYSDTINNVPYIRIVYEAAATNSTTPDGLLIFNINGQQLADTLFGKENTSDEAYILSDKNGDTVFSYALNKKNGNSHINDTNCNSEYKISESDGKRMIYSELPQYGLSLCSSYDINEMTGKRINNNTIIAGFAVIVLLSILFSFFSAMYLYNSIIQIISNLEKKLYLSDNTGFKATSNEISYINNKIVELMDKSGNLEQELINKNSEFRKLQAISLQSQIRPHFIFNTLNAISAVMMKISKGDNEASRMIKLLSEILRVNLCTPECITTVSQEIEYTKKFVEIEKIKCLNSFDVIWDIDEEISECKIIKLTLQPIIENAIEHGIKPIIGKKDGEIKVTSKKDGDSIVITVSDNGAGISEDRLKEIKKDLYEEKFPDSKNIGLMNVNKRTKLIFGKLYGIGIESNNGTTTVTYTIPLKI